VAGVSVQDIELVYKQDRAMLSDAVSSTEVRMCRTLAGVPAVHQVRHQSVVFSRCSLDIKGETRPDIASLRSAEPGHVLFIYLLFISLFINPHQQHFRLHYDAAQHMAGFLCVSWVFCYNLQDMLLC